LAAFLTANNLVIDEYSNTATFTVTLSGVPEGTVTVDYALFGGTAVESQSYDFTASDGTLTFLPGTTTQTITVNILGAQPVEPLQSFFLSLSSPVNASIANNFVLGTIVDNDDVVSDDDVSGAIESDEKANLSVRDVVVDERAGTATFDLILSQATTEAFTVQYSTESTLGTALAGADYAAEIGSIEFAAGQTSQRITVNLVDDSTVENNEFFHLTLGALSGGGAGQVQLGDGMGTAHIGRSDQTGLAAPVISASAIVVTEGDGYAEFVVQLSAPGTKAVSVNYSFSGGSAVESASYDFLAVDGVLTFTPGTTTQTVRVDLVTAQGAELPESFTLNLSNPVNASVATASVTATVYDDDNGHPHYSYGIGNDVYVITDSTQQIAEAVDAGTDLVKSSINFSLVDTDGGGAFGGNIENLLLTGSAANGTGNGLANLLTGNSGVNTLTGQAGNDTLDGSGGADSMVGGSGNDGANTLSGAAGNDTLDGGSGADNMTGGSGNDVYRVGTSSDVVKESASGGVDRVISTISLTLGSEVENLSLSGSSNLNGTGNSLTNVLVGNTGKNTLNGGSGSDTLTGGSEADTFVIASVSGSDTLTDFDSGLDKLRVSQGSVKVGDGDTSLEGAVKLAGPGGFSAAAELVILSGNIAGDITASKAAAAIGSASSAYATGRTVLFVVDNGDSSALYRFTSSASNAAVSSAELDLIATFDGTSSVVAGDFLFGA
jgi:Ca2+-binding RTX toxin-like protein